MSKKEREICEFEMDLRSNLSNDNTISAYRPSLKTDTENYIFGLKSSQDLENRAAHPHQEFPGVPPGKMKLSFGRHEIRE